MPRYVWLNIQLILNSGFQIHHINAIACCAVPQCRGILFFPMIYEVHLCRVCLMQCRGVSWPSGLAYRTQVLVLAAECGFESRPWHLCPWARHLIIIASLGFYAYLDLYKVWMRLQIFFPKKYWLYNLFLWMKFYLILFSQLGTKEETAEGNTS